MEPFIGEIRLFPWDWPPKGWALCEGALLSIGQNTALFSLLGTIYGGDGRTSFALPDLRGRAAIDVGPNFTLGERYGSEEVTVTLAQMPSHNHGLMASSQDGTTASSLSGLLSTVGNSTEPHYATATTVTPLNAQAVQTVGGSQAHNNMQPYLVLNYSIALYGLYPSRN